MGLDNGGVEKRSFDLRSFFPACSRGVIILGAMLFISTLFHMHKLVVDRDWYIEVYDYLPPALIVARYAFSWLQRIIGMLVALGILACNDTARKAAIILGVFSMLVGPWKHAQTGFQAHAKYLDAHFGHLLYQLGYGQVSFVSVAKSAAICQWIADIIFWCATIYFLTRPSVIRQFQRKK